MRTIIAGGRDLKIGYDFYLIEDAIKKCGWVPTVVLSGTARGGDQIGEWWAEENNKPLELYYPDWKRYNLGAGKIRNVEMATKAEALIALWNGYSKGTGHMIDTARKLNLKVHVELY
jgi:YspA, cpYpsA-related SLOG family